MAGPDDQDTTRRDFFRTFGRETVRQAGTVAGAAAELRRSSLAAARVLFDPEAETTDQPAEPIDAINDISAAQIALRQRWQTKRGGPGRWRSVDFFTFNVEGNFFANQPDDDELAPTRFRGLFFDSLPEASIPLTTPTCPPRPSIRSSLPASRAPRESLPTPPPPSPKWATP